MGVKDDKAEKIALNAVLKGGIRPRLPLVARRDLMVARSDEIAMSE